MNSVALSMNRTAGQSIFCFVLRVVGTAIATIGCYIIWYIVDGKLPGVIVFLWLWIFMAFYVVLKTPRFTLTSTISMVTMLVVVGYELQVQTIGVQLAEQSGQPAYPIYELAPYRLAAVVSGLLIALYVDSNNVSKYVGLTRQRNEASGQSFPTRSPKPPS